MHSYHTLPLMKDDHSDEQANRPAPEYMDINTDDAEAGSILMSLSQQTKKIVTPTATTSASTTMSTSTASTMSIRNLLGDDDQRMEPTSRKQSNLNDGTSTYTTTAWSQEKRNIHRYPEMVKKTSPPPQQSDYSFERRQPYGMRHAQQPTSTHLLPAAPTHMRSTDTSAAHGPSESHDWQQHPSHRSIKQIQHQHNPSYSQQSFQSMKKNPKIRRNALHAYISYMTYSDLVRTKANSTSHHTYNRQPMTKQHIPAGITEMKTEHHHPSPHQHQPPLTAFLKQYADPQPSIHQSVSTPTTPRPKQVLPSLDHQQQLNYPSPTTSRPQYYQPYPPYSPLHNNSDRRR